MSAPGENLKGLQHSPFSSMRSAFEATHFGEHKVTHFLVPSVAQNGGLVIPCREHFVIPASKLCRWNPVVCDSLLPLPPPRLCLFTNPRGYTQLKVLAVA